MNKLEKKKPVFKGLTFRLLAMSIIPILIFGVVMTVSSALLIQGGMNKEIQEALKNSLFVVDAALINLGDGDFEEDSDGNITKDGVVISNNQELLGEGNERTGIDLTVFYGDTRILTTIKDASGEYIVGTQAAGPVVDKVLKEGEEYFSTSVLVNGADYYGYYYPLRSNDGKVIGMLFAGKPVAEAKAYMDQSVLKLFVIAIGLLLLCLIDCLLVIRSIVRSTKKAEEAAKIIASGNLATPPDEKVIKRSDEIGDIARSIEAIRASLKDTVGVIVHNSQTLAKYSINMDELLKNVNRNSSEVSKAVEGISEGAISQADEVQTASESVNLIGKIIEEISKSLGELEDTAAVMQNSGDESTFIIQELDESNEKTVEAVEKISEQIAATNNSAHLINEAINIITNIAEETNLLSLNASIEAARAGEQGRGFAVVAGEIQKLAEQSSESAQRIRKIIDNLLKDADKTVEVMKDVKVTVAEQHKKLEETKEKFEKVSVGITSSLEGIGDINRSAKTLSKSRETIIEVIENLSAISEENAASSQETAASVLELSENIETVAGESTGLKDLSEELENKANLFVIE